MTTRPRSYQRANDVRADAQRLLAANDAAVAWFRSNLATAEEPRRYLVSRGLGTLVDREWPWRVGYAPPTWSGLTDHLRAAGFSSQELVVAGLAQPTRADPSRLIDVFRDRVVFPIRNPAGHVVAFIGRASDRCVEADPQLPKYLNTHESPLYHKDRVLFGVAEQEERIRASWRPVLVEGPADAIATWLSYSRSGASGAVAVAPCGTALSGVQARILNAMPGSGDGIVVAFDGDPAGRKAAVAAFDLLRRPQGRRRLLAAEFPAGADPAEMITRPNGRAQLRAALRHQTRPLVFAIVDHHLNRMLARSPQLLDDIGGRYDAARLLAPRVLDAIDPQEAYWLARHIVERTTIAERAHDGVSTVMAYAAEGLQRRVDDLTTGHDTGQAAGASRPPPQGFPRLRLAQSEPVVDQSSPARPPPGRRPSGPRRA